jgi:Flp pilus assembly protein TadG
LLKPKRSATRLLQGEKPGQALVLLAVAFFALLAFIGLVTDVGSIYVSYDSLQRAVDAAAVSAANNVKNPASPQFREKIKEAAREMLQMHKITGIADDQFKLYLCDDISNADYDGPANFTAMCQGTKRKLAFVRATQQSPVYFLQIFGVRSFPVTVSAVGETAAVDLVIVMDTSESMASELVNPADPYSFRTPSYSPNQYNPNLSPDGCNINNTCYPLKEAKDAASTLVANLFDGYDRVAIVTFSYTGTLVLGLTDNLAGTVQNAIVNDIRLHDDLDSDKVRWYNQASPLDGISRTFNPIYPEDRDGDGKDADPNAPCTDVNPDPLIIPPEVPDGWDYQTGDPCDSATISDAIDWDWTGGPHHFDGGGAPGNYDNLPSFESTSPLSTCSGCGIRVATETLAGSGRPGAVWVIVYLSDGVTNLSDTYATNPLIVKPEYTYGFCGPTPADTATSFWSSYCIDRNLPGSFSEGRYCIDEHPNECPQQSNDLATFPNTVINTTDTSGPYSVEDYAFDMVDRAGLLSPFVDAANHKREPAGENIVMFSVGLDAARASPALLRYMANIGDDGSRANDPCAGLGATVSCGNYYYLSSSDPLFNVRLNQIFENIAGRIFTKISR